MSRRAWIVLNLVVDGVILNLAVIVAFVLRLGWPIPQYNFAAYEQAALFMTVGQLLILAAVDLYEPTAERSGPELFGAVVKGIALGGLVLVSLTFFLRAFAFPRVVILLALLLEVLLLWSWRRLAAGVLHIRWPERRILLVGALDDSLEIATRLEDMRKWGYRVVGIVGPGDAGTADRVSGGVQVAEATAWPAASPHLVALSAAAQGPAGASATGGLERAGLAQLGPLLQGLTELPEQLDSLRPHQIIFTTPAQHREVLEQVSLSRMFEGDIYVVPQLYEMHLGEVNFSLLGDMPLLRLNRASGPRGETC